MEQTEQVTVTVECEGASHWDVFPHPTDVDDLLCFLNDAVNTLSSLMGGDVDVFRVTFEVGNPKPEEEN
jgi:hypothetical protein